jgi:hypothetical protein
MIRNILYILPLIIFLRRKVPGQTGLYDHLWRPLDTQTDHRVKGTLSFIFLCALVGGSLYNYGKISTCTEGINASFMFSVLDLDNFLYESESDLGGIILIPNFTWIFHVHCFFVISCQMVVTDDDIQITIVTSVSLTCFTTRKGKHFFHFSSCQTQLVHSSSHTRSSIIPPRVIKDSLPRHTPGTSSYARIRVVRFSPLYRSRGTTPVYMYR